jgi:hypothetical protein
MRAYVCIRVLILNSVLIVRLFYYIAFMSTATNNLLIYHCKEGNVDRVRKILSKQACDPSYNESEALSSAVFRSNYDVVQLLMQDGRVNPVDYYCHPIRTAFITMLSMQDDVVSFHTQDPVEVKKILDLMLADDRVTPYDVCNALEYCIGNSYLDGRQDRCYKYLRHWNGKGVGAKYRKFINAQMKLKFV